MRKSAVVLSLGGNPLWNLQQNNQIPVKNVLTISPCLSFPLYNEDSNLSFLLPFVLLAYLDFFEAGTVSYFLYVR